MAMTLADYAALYNAISHMSCDIESECPRYNDVIFPEDWNKDCAAIYALVKGMVDCINDVPRGLVEYAVKQGLVLPEVDIDFSGDTPALTIDGEVIE
jgi:hypothetical protein